MPYGHTRGRSATPRGSQSDASSNTAPAAVRRVFPRPESEGTETYCLERIGVIREYFVISNYFSALGRDERRAGAVCRTAAASRYRARHARRLHPLAALHAHTLRRLHRLPAPCGRRGGLQSAGLLPLENRRADLGPRDGELRRGGAPACAAAGGRDVRPSRRHRRPAAREPGAPGRDAALPASRLRAQHDHRRPTTRSSSACARPASCSPRRGFSKTGAVPCTSSTWVSSSRCSRAPGRRPTSHSSTTARSSRAPAAPRPSTWRSR